MVIKKDFASSKNTWVMVGTWIDVNAIEVHPTLIGAIVTPHNSIRVQHRDELEHKLAAKEFCPWVFLI